MKQRDVLLLMDGIAPTIAGLLKAALAPMVARLEEVEKQLAEARAELASRPDIAAMVAAEVEKATADRFKAEPIDADAIERAIEERCARLEKRLDDLPEAASAADLERLAADQTEVRELVKGLPGPDGLAALVEKTVAAAFDPVTIGRSIDDRVAGAFATMTVPRNGADADPDITRAMVVEQVAAAMPTAEDVAARMPVPQPGKDADPDVTAALVRDEVAKAVAALPPALPGKDADHEVVRAMVLDAVAALPPAAPGKDASPEDIAAAVEKVLATWERPKDGAPVTIEQMQPVVDAAVDKAMAARPLPESGKDGRGIAGLLKDHEGYLVATFTDGATLRIARVDGEKGLDGFGFDDLDVVDEPTAFVLRFTKGERVKEFRLAKPTLADSYRGVWRDRPHKAGDAVTHGGSLWIALRDTKEKPESGDDWRLAVKKGRDGKDGEAPKPPPTIKLK